MNLSDYNNSAAKTCGACGMPTDTLSHGWGECAPKDEAKTGPRGVVKGSVFVASWGYDQTNVDAYVVTRVMAKSVAIMKCRLKAEGEGHQRRMVPDPTSPVPFDPDGWNLVDGKVTRRGEIIKLVQYWDDEPRIKLFHHTSAYLWDTERSYFDTIEAGYPGH